MEGLKSGLDYRFVDSDTPGNSLSGVPSVKNERGSGLSPCTPEDIGRTYIDSSPAAFRPVSPRAASIRTLEESRTSSPTRPSNISDLRALNFLSPQGMNMSSVSPASMALSQTNPHFLRPPFSSTGLGFSLGDSATTTQHPLWRGDMQADRFLQGASRFFWCSDASGLNTGGGGSGGRPGDRDNSTHHHLPQALRLGSSVVGSNSFHGLHPDPMRFRLSSSEVLAGSTCPRINMNLSIPTYLPFSLLSPWATSSSKTPVSLGMSNLLAQHTQERPSVTPRSDTSSPELRHLLRPSTDHRQVENQYSPSEGQLVVPLEEGAAQEEWKADEAKLRELEQFAANFKSRRIKLGYTQTNVGTYRHLHIYLF